MNCTTLLHTQTCNTQCCTSRMVNMIRVDQPHVSYTMDSHMHTIGKAIILLFADSVIMCIVYSIWIDFVTVCFIGVYHETCENRECGIKCTM